MTVFAWVLFVISCLEIAVQPYVIGKTQSITPTTSLVNILFLGACAVFLGLYLFR